MTSLAAGKDIHIKLSSLTQADGSAQFKLGKTATLACVNGPDQVRICTGYQVPWVMVF